MTNTTIEEQKQGGPVRDLNHFEDKEIVSMQQQKKLFKLYQPHLAVVLQQRSFSAVEGIRFGRT